MAVKMPIRIRERTPTVGAMYDYVKSKEVPPGEIWCLQGIAYENESTLRRGAWRRYIEGHGYDHFVAEHPSTLGNELVDTNDLVYLLPGERLVVRIYGAGPPDVLALYAHGYKVHTKFLPDGEG